MLDDFGIVGVSWRQGGSEALADYSLPSADQAECLRAFAAANELSEIAYLETCNRVEVIFLRSTEAAAEDIRSSIYELLTGRRPLGLAKPSASLRRGAAKVPLSTCS